MNESDCQVPPLLLVIESHILMVDLPTARSSRSLDSRFLL